MTEREPEGERNRSSSDEAPDLPASGPFRIHTVSELTGVPEPTLRAWERRYGIPKPERSASGYRLYAGGEVEQVRELRRLCDEGMAAAEAAKVVLAQRTSASASAPVVPPHAAAIERILGAIRRFDDAELDRELRKLLFLGTAITILDEVVTPLLYEVGRLWHSGELSVAEEHLASQRIGTLLRDLVRLSPGALSEQAVVLASFADDEHDLGLLAMALRFSGWGLRPVFLGARTPPGAIRSAVRAMSPALVALSVTQPPERSRARELVDDYASACGDVPWIVGGGAAGAIADLIQARGGVLADRDPAELRRSVRALLSAGSGPGASATSSTRTTKSRRSRP
ncbi:MAG: MerR family DNA-binding transcriptional regulator [Myxococcales bacterium]|nr:MerR family DNA-binding transcriptional regulator [Myxococcales bacterium]